MLCRLAVRSSVPQAAQTLASHPTGFLPALTNGALLNVWDLEALQSSVSGSPGTRNGDASESVGVSSRVAALERLYNAPGVSRGTAEENNGGEEEYLDAVAREWLRARSTSIVAP